jgi:hypothetical protein
VRGRLARLRAGSPRSRESGPNDDQGQIPDGVGFAMSIISQDKSYSFSDYFEMNYPTEDIVGELGYQYELTKLTLPRGKVEHSLENLQAMFYKKLPHISLTSEIAKREVMIAPVLLELLDEIDVKIDI